MSSAEKKKEKEKKISKFKTTKNSKSLRWFGSRILAIRERINFIGKTSGVGDLCRTNVADSVSPAGAFAPRSRIC